MSIATDYISITIGGVVVQQYLKKYEVTIKKIYDENLNYTTISGQKISKILGVQREIKVSFEPMNTTQIGQLFSAIGLSDAGTTILYIDPIKGSTTSTFTTEQLPAATFFRADDGIDFWTIPVITFVEKTVDTSSWGGA